MEIRNLLTISANVRKNIVKMLNISGSGHPGGSLSAVELLVTLYFKYMNFNPKSAFDPDRDYFILSKGHSCPVLYSILAELGCFSISELYTFRKIGSRLQGHPSKNERIPGIEVSTGSLGYGLSIGIGIAIGIKQAKKRNRVYVLMGDGEQQEGSVWEGVMAASHYKLDNLCAIIDDNGMQIDGATKDIMNIEPLADKYKAFGWNVISIDGHNIGDIDKSYSQFIKGYKKPTVIIAKTVKGKGVSFMENLAIWHGKVPSSEELKKALKEIDKNLKQKLRNYND
ncbi:MAG: transketolase [Endomicrobium sp.]|jgi:transketolase|nr:transketolase [Endomicrobium sp.]